MSLDLNTWGGAAAAIINLFPVRNANIAFYWQVVATTINNSAAEMGRRGLKGRREAVAADGSFSSKAVNFYWIDSIRRIKEQTYLIAMDYVFSITN
jgi:hypothetical protein